VNSRLSLNNAINYIFSKKKKSPKFFLLTMMVDVSNWNYWCLYI